MVKYKRILLKISGEAFGEGKNLGLCEPKLLEVAHQIKKVVELGVELGVVVGGGNFWRGRQSQSIDRATADYIGILATTMNSLALGDMLTSIGVKNKVLSSVQMDKIAETYFLPYAKWYLDQGYVVILAGGTGSPFFTTDTTAALRACEIQADAIFCAKSVDGVYDSDPAINKNAKKFDTLTYDEVLEKNLKVLDLTATAMCREYNIPLVVFSKEGKNSIVDAVSGKNLGTIIK